MQALGKKQHCSPGAGESLLKGLEFPALLPQETLASFLLQPQLESAVSLSQLCSVAEGWGHRGSQGLGVPSITAQAG